MRARRLVALLRGALLVALWSGILQVGGDGKVTVPFQIPSYRGQVRVMAFTHSATKIGRAEAQVIVKDPLVVQTTFPRFVTHNDDIMVPVFLTNMSGGPLEVSVKIESAHLPMPGISAPPNGKDGALPLTFAGKSATTLKIANGFAEITTRVCLTYYLERQFGMDAEAPKSQAVRQQIVLVNRGELVAAREEVGDDCGLDPTAAARDDD